MFKNKLVEEVEQVGKLIDWNRDSIDRLWERLTALERYLGVNLKTRPDYEKIEK